MSDLKKISIFAFAFLLLGSCASDPVERALDMAGDNRPELEKVLDHYSIDPEDALKLKAAEFLISNMPAHSSYTNHEYMEKYANELADSVSSLFPAATNVATIERITKRYDRSKFSELASDVKLIGAEYLIDNIDRAFDAWENGEWSVHVGFDDFCEYILPYKATDGQLLDNWREYSEPLFKGNIDTLHHSDLYRNSVYHAATTVCNQIKTIGLQEPPAGMDVLPILKASAMSTIPLGTCSDYTMLAMSVMRSKGIPVVEDYTPHWPFQEGGHSWNVLLDNNFTDLRFSAGGSNPGEIHKPDEKMAKVFRRTFAINDDVLAIHASEENVPGNFANVCTKDVTDEYMDTRDVEIKIPREFRGKYSYAYLAVFDKGNWIPIHYGKVSGGKVKFDKMGKNCLYLPVFYGTQGIVPFSPPFRLTPQGEVVRYDGEPDAESRTVTVRRKYFIGKHCYDVGRRLEGGTFRAANRGDLSDSVIIYRIPDFTTHSSEFDIPKQTPQYRYWWYMSADRHCSVLVIGQIARILPSRSSCA